MVNGERRFNNLASWYVVVPESRRTISFFSIRQAASFAIRCFSSANRSRFSRKLGYHSHRFPGDRPSMGAAQQTRFLQLF